MTDPELYIVDVSNSVARKVRAIHHYGCPPDPRLQHDVDADVVDIVSDVIEALRTVYAELDEANKKLNRLTRKP